MTWDTELAAAAREYLPSDQAAEYISRLRPAISLQPRVDAGRPVAARLGGCPGLPAGTAWPTGAHGSPLWFAASVDCAVVAAAGTLDIALPAEGILLFFQDPVTCEETDAAVIYVPPGTGTDERATPDGVEPYPALELCAVQDATEPGGDHPLLAASASDHRIGGWPGSIHFPVEYSAEMYTRNVTWEHVVDKDTDWILLAQFDLEAVDEGREHGTAYWLMKPEDLAGLRFGKAMSTIQAH